MCLWGPMGRHFLIFWGRYAPLRSVKVSEENLYWGSAPCRPVLCWDTKSRGLGFLIPPLMRILVWFQSTWMTSQLSTRLSTHRTSSVGRVILLVCYWCFCLILCPLSWFWERGGPHSFWLRDGFSEHTSFLLFESQGHCSLGAWSILYSLCPYVCQYLLFVLCILSCYLWSSFQLHTLSSRMGNLQSYRTSPGVTWLGTFLTPESGHVMGLTWSWDVYFLLLLPLHLSF